MGKIAPDALEPMYATNRNLSVSYDVSQLLRQGGNGIGAVLSMNHYWKVEEGLVHYKHKEVSKPRWIAIELHVTLEDGSQQGSQVMVLENNAKWTICKKRNTRGTYDATKEIQAGQSRISQTLTGKLLWIWEHSKETLRPSTENFK